MTRQKYTTDEIQAHYAAVPPDGNGLVSPPDQPARKPRKRKRVFMWTFFTIQAVFVVWIIVGMATIHTGPTPAEVAQMCGHGQWQGLFTSLRDCQIHGANGLNQAGTIGKGIGLALVIGLWVAADVILGVGRLVVVLARKR